MRFTLTLTASMATIALAQEGGFAQYKAQFQNLLGKFGAYVPNNIPSNPVAAVEQKVGSLTVSTLTLENWKDTLFKPVKPAATTPEEWYLFISGRNKTCFGRCERAEKAFNETAARFAVLPKRPHMALLNCDDQPVLCNSWSASTGVMWAVEMLPAPAAIDIYRTRLNLTTVTSDDIVSLYKAGDHKGFTLHESFFHPFNGKAAEYGVAVPIGYALWAFSLVPQWAMMVIVSLVSRSMMSNRMQNMQNQRPGAPGAAAAAPAQ